MTENIAPGPIREGDKWILVIEGQRIECGTRRDAEVLLRARDIAYKGHTASVAEIEEAIAVCDKYGRVTACSLIGRMLRSRLREAKERERRE